MEGLRPTVVRRSATEYRGSGENCGAARRRAVERYSHANSGNRRSGIVCYLHNNRTATEYLAANRVGWLRYERHACDGRGRRNNIDGVALRDDLRWSRAIARLNRETERARRCWCS